MKERDQERALEMIDSDPGLRDLRHLRGPYLDLEVRGSSCALMGACVVLQSWDGTGLRDVRRPALALPRPGGKGGWAVGEAARASKHPPTRSHLGAAASRARQLLHARLCHSLSVPTLTHHAHA